MRMRDVRRNFLCNVVMLHFLIVEALAKPSAQQSGTGACLRATRRQVLPVNHGRDLPAPSLRQGRRPCHKRFCKSLASKRWKSSAVVVNRSFVLLAYDKVKQQRRKARQNTLFSNKHHHTGPAPSPHLLRPSNGQNVNCQGLAPSGWQLSRAGPKWLAWPQVAGKWIGKCGGRSYRLSSHRLRVKGRPAPA